ncbi:XapX domain-containing protein [Mesorhizobium sp. M0622]|uniref:XapX domain-containing protein n=1 Tax=unclassified Mesorhizobium TaxID=325217 RepID=UPI00333B3884
MKAYVISLAAGLLVGIIYGLLNVRSPAPPIIALVGLLGILIGEQLPPLIKNMWRSEPAALSWLHQVRPHVFGHLPQGGLPSESPGSQRADTSAQG